MFVTKMKYKKIQLLLFIILNFMVNSLHAQMKNNNISDISPMHEFLMKNSDTTFVLKYESNWLVAPEYLIISKKGDTITAYTYKSNPGIDKRIILPHSIAYALYKRNKFDIMKAAVDINFYFNPIYFPQDTLKMFWNSIMDVSPFKIKDDTIEGKGCPIINNKNQKRIDDGGGIALDLITKEGTKRLSFYAPEFFEEVCPGRNGRKSIITISKLFTRLFKENMN